MDKENDIMFTSLTKAGADRRRSETTPGQTRND